MVASPAPSSCGPTALGRVLALDQATFAREHWDRLPLLTRASDLPMSFADLFSSEAVDSLVGNSALRTPFFKMVKEGSSLGEATRKAVAGNKTIGDLADPDAVARAFVNGATLVLQSLHRMHAPIGAFCRGLAAELGHPTQCNAYATPAGTARGFDFHHDTHDVIVMQIEGTKHWLVHAPVLELPTKGQPRSGPGLVADGQIPVLDVVLAPGDTLYLPRGFVHAADTSDEASLHLTVGFVATTWFDVLHEAVTTLAPADLELRRALPLRNCGGPVADVAANELLKRAADWLTSITAEQVTALMADRLGRAETVEPASVMARARALVDLGVDTRLRLRTGLSAALQSDGDRVVLSTRVVTLGFPEQASRLLARALASQATAAELVEGDPVCDIADALVVVRRLVREGVLVCDD